MSDTNPTPETVVLPTQTVVLPTQTFVDPDKFATLAAEKGLIVHTQSAWMKVFRSEDGSKGPRLYVANGKTCRAIAISAFEAPLSIASPAGKLAQGSVKQQMKLEGTEKEVLARFSDLIDCLISQPASPPPAKKEPKAKKTAAVEEPTTPETLPEPIKLVAGECPTVEQV
jgi:hypothetical protein